MPVIVCDISEMKRRVTYSGVHRVVYNLLLTVPNELRDKILIGYVDANGVYNFENLDGSICKMPEVFGILNLDLTLDFTDIKVREFKKMQKNIVFSATYLPDVLPITKPHFFESNLVSLFDKYFEEIAAKSDVILTNSESSKASINSLLSSRDAKKSKIPIDVFPLATDLKSLSESNGLHLRRSVFEVFKKQEVPVYSWLSTIEPRKNLCTVLKAVEALARIGTAFKLLVMGKFGWHCEAEFAQLERLCHEYPAHVHLVHFPSDLEIRYALTASHALIVSSFDEGYGLPLIEGAALGTHIICSDIPVFRATMGENATYFNPNSISDLQLKIMETLNFEKIHPGCHRHKPASWSTVSESLFRHLLRRLPCHG
jgi:glycosyltransferase involved in cell wall biosynthesis